MHSTFTRSAGRFALAAPFLASAAASGIAHAGQCTFYLDHIQVSYLHPEGRTWDDQGTDYEAPDIRFRLDAGWSNVMSTEIKPDRHTSYWQKTKKFSCKAGTDLIVNIVDDDAFGEDRILRWEGTVEDLVNVSAHGGLKGEGLVEFVYSFTFVP